MLSLIRSDFRRILADKLTLVIGIIAVAFALFTPLLYKLIFSFAGMEEDMELMMALGFAPTAKSLYFAAMMPGDNLGLIASILLGIVICKDFSQGTVRNKIIAGKSRTNIFLSLLITSSTVLCVIMLAHALLTLAVSLLFFSYQNVDFTINDFWYLLASTGMKMLTFIFVGSLITLIATVTKNIGLTIVLYIAVAMGLTIIGSITMIATTLPELPSTVDAVIQFFNNTNLFISSFVGAGTSYSIAEALYGTLTPIIWTAALCLLGIFRFNESDVK